MFPRFYRPAVLAAGIAACLASFSRSEVVSVSFTEPALDRWMYPFNFAAGAEARASLFAAVNQAGFDDRDGQLLVGFDTAEFIPAGRGRLSYKILSATLKVYVENDNAFFYDPTPDPLASSFAPNDPEYVPDADPSKPIEVWPAGYRNGTTAATFLEDSGFGGTPDVFPAQGARNVFPSLLDHAQIATDVSNQVRTRLAANPIALGRLFDSDGELAPGTLVPQGSEIRFTLADAASANIVYLQNALDTGLVRLLITTLEPTSGGPGGGTGGVTYPRIYTKESVAAALGYAPSLTLEVALTCAADFNGDDLVDDSDFVIFVAAYNELLDARCDLNGDTVTDDADFVDFASAYNDLLCN
ncbi:MAG: hypothetical protein JNK16_09200 [Phycisphaerales bacterium]|nr:hypothetical protein [Phycisphaerales bacterium]